MKDLLEKKFFPYVIKPGRYAGGEIGQIVKDPSGKTKYLHAFPDKYELGQAYFGLQSIYHLVNQDDRFLCERVFAVDIDAEELMRRENISLFSLESYRPAKEFDAIGFTLSFELVYTNVLAMLDLAGIPLRWNDRDDTHPIIMAGGPTVYNPEPLANFIDLFFIGDAEEGLLEMLAILHEMKDQPREAKLEAIVRKVKSVYVPRFYDNNRKPIVDFSPNQIEARVIPELKDEYYPRQPIVPLIDIVHNYLGIEIMRGCPQGCRFCQAGPIYRPVRMRPPADISRQVETQLQLTGYDEISLLSLSSSDYSEIGNLASLLAKKLANQRISVALPSLRPGSINAALLDAISLVRKVGLTLAPEAGTERLRQFLRKDFPDEAIYDSVRLAFEKGWNTIKLYFMIGLPTETEEDLIGIASIIRNVQEIASGYPGKKTINVTLSPFSPKPHTPLQWDDICPPEEILHRFQFIKKRCQLRQVHFKTGRVETSMLQGVMGRADRNAGDIILTAFEKGCRFDGWSEHFDWGKWTEAFEHQGVDFNEGFKAIPFATDLPWSHVRKGVTVEHLQAERQRTSFQLKEYHPVSSEKKNDSPDMAPIEYGRSRKRVASRTPAVAPTKNRLRIMWGKTSRFKYLSHLDNIRLIERSLRRSRMPTAYSQGFNPTMKLSFGPPLPLGFTSETELVDIVLETNVMPYMIENLSKVLPDGIYIIGSSVIMGKQSLGSLLNRVTYTLPYENIHQRSELEKRVASILEKTDLKIMRTGKEKITSVDIRPAIYDLQVDDSYLVMTLGIGEGGYVRPNEILLLLSDESTCREHTFNIHRKVVYRENENGELIYPMEL